MRGLPVATHVDGLEWQRAKWPPMGRRYYRMAESLAVRWSDALIADAKGIREYYDREFGVATELITYGAPVIEPQRPERLAEFDLTPQRYHLVVARFEPENHVDVIVAGYAASNADAAARRRRRRALFRRLHRTHQGHGRQARALPRFGLGPVAARRALRQRLHLSARPLRRRHEPVAAACRRCRRRDGRLLGVVQPRRAR